MKTIQSFITVLLIMFLACDKDEDICVKTAFFDSGFETLNETDFIQAKSLFIKNNLNYENKQFILLTETELDIIVDCYQYVNGLKVFTDHLKYFFRLSDQRLDFLLGDTLLPESIDLGITPLMESNNVFSLYRSIVIKDEEDIYWNNPRCYVIEFGYYDLNVSTNLDPVYVPAWKVRPEQSSVPVAYFNDTTQELIYYFNGVFN